MNTIKSSREIDMIFRESRRAAHPLGVVLIAKTPDGRGPGGRVAFIAGKRIGNAVARNRAKRVLRATVARAGGPLPGHDVALIANARTGSATPEELDRMLARAFSKVAP